MTRAELKQQEKNRRAAANKLRVFASTVAQANNGRKWVA